MKKTVVLLSGLFLVIFALWRIVPSVFAEQSGSSPESGSDSRIKTAYDWLVAKGTNYGSTDAADWDSATTYAWGTDWNRIMEAAAWEPDGSATASDVPSGFTFYAGLGDRTQKTGTLFQNQTLMDYDDWNCANNNAESATACAAGDSEYTGEEGTWTLKASGGTAVNVTDNSVTVTIASNKVYQDSWTKLYWSDANAGGNIIDNEFAYVDGDDRTNPTGNSCNFNSAGTANAYCDNQDPLAAYVEDNDVSAADFCLNLQLDGDNADGDSNGATGVETNWRLPTQKELMQAYIDGAANNLPNPGSNFWSSTEYYSSQSFAWYVPLTTGGANGNT
ncbi:MAG: hypothetical protein WAV56_04995, partial [Microgenomates group bacterium]